MSDLVLPNAPATFQAKFDITLPEIDPKIGVGEKDRTPRKSGNPQHTPLREERNDSAALLTFKLVNSDLTPELDIVSSTPRAKKLKAKRRLWGGGVSDSSVVPIDLNIKQNKSPQVDSSSSRSTGDEDSMEGSDSQNNSPETGIEMDEKCYTLKCSQYSAKTKTCASCDTKKTPLWRDADDGTPYCNACGIRFKKYRIRCPACLYVPRKDEKTADNSCFMCGFQLVRCKFTTGHAK